MAIGNDLHLPTYSGPNSEQINKIIQSLDNQQAMQWARSIQGGTIPPEIMKSASPNMQKVIQQYVKINTKPLDTASKTIANSQSSESQARIKEQSQAPTKREALQATNS